MQHQEELSKVAQELETQVQFLGGQIPVYETTELGQKRLKEVVETVERTIALLKELRPEMLASAAKAAAGAMAKAGDEADAPRPAAQEKVERPGEGGDLGDWLAFWLQNPEDSEALETVERLGKAAEKEGNWDQAVDLYLARVELEENADDRITALIEVARIYEQEIGDLGKAFTAILAAVAEDPASAALLEEMDRLAEATEQWSDLVSALNTIAPDVQDKELAARLWLKLGRVYYERLDRPDYAVPSLWHGLEKNPKLADAWDELATIYKQKEQWTDLASVIIKRLDTTEDKQERIFFLLELGDLYEARLGNANEARIRYEEVLRLEPDHPDAMAAMDAVLRNLELWEPLTELLVKKADLAQTPATARSARREAADLMARELEDARGAAPLYEKLLADTPEDQGLLEVLYHIYEEIEDTKDFLRIAGMRAKIVDDPDLKIRILRRMAGELIADASRRPEAAEVLEQIIELDPKNEVTYRDLEDIYIKQEAWDELATTYRRHATMATAPSMKGEMLRAMGAVLDEKLHDPSAAVDAFNEALTVDDKDLNAMVQLSSLLERQEHWLELTDVLSRRAELTSEEVERVELHRRIGEIALERLGDSDAAEKRLMKALELDPDHTGAMMALVTLYRSREEWLRAANMLADAERASANRLEKARLLFEAAELHREKLEDMDKAVGLFSKVLLVDPEHQQAAAALADHYYDRKQWDDAEPLYDLLLRKVDDKQRKRKLEIHIRLGLAAKRLKKVEKAIRNLEAAREMDPTSLDVLRELADLKFHMESWKDAATLYQAVLVAHREHIPPKELVEVYHRLGSVKMELGERDKALNLFEKALEIDAAYDPSVKAVLLLREEGGDFESIVVTKVAMFHKTTDDDEKHRLAVEIGDLYISRLNEPDKGLEYYKKAAALKPLDRHVLHKMLESYTAREKWEETAETVLELAHLEPSAQIKAKYLYTAALVYRDELQKVDQGLIHMEECLDANPTFENAFDAIERALTEREDWTELARALRRQFKRLPETAPVPMRLSFLDRLGEIYSEKLGEAETAVAAYEAADVLDPTNADRKSKLAQLYLQAGPDKIDKAIAQHHALLRQSPYKIQLYKDLTELYIRAQKKDATWCMCAALNFLKKASDKEQIFFDRYRPRELVMAQRRLTDALWRDLVRHPSESSRIDAIFAGVMQQAALLNAQPHKKFGLKRAEKVNPEEDSQTVFQMLVYAARVLDIQPRPELFTRGDQPQPIQVANATEKGALLPTWLVDAAKFEGKTRREVVFEVARQLTHMRHERYLWRALVSQTDLFNVLYAALSIVLPDAPVPDTPDVSKMAAHLRKTVPPIVFEQLTPVAKELLAAGADEANLANWILATQRTGLRAALLLTNDFQVVAKLVATEPDAVTGLAAKDRVADLLQFSVSPEYLSLRSHMGFEVK